MNSKQFESDLIQFILNHPYISGQSDESTITHNTEQDRIDIELPTPDGDYEQTHIRIQHIP
jgi:hypothetical protein